MAKVELIKTVECPRLQGKEIPVEKCQARKFHVAVDEKNDKVTCGFP